MKKIDSIGSKLCSYQGKIFEESLDRFMCSSKVFLRRFFNSEFALFLDTYQQRIFTFETEECFLSLLEEYGDSTYGKIKINKNALYYLGYLTRYICYTRDITSAKLFDVMNIYDIVDNYFVYHTQDEEWVIANILEKQHLTENDINTDEILKNLYKQMYFRKGKKHG